MGLDLYYLAGSPPCRAVMMTAKTLGIELNYKITSVLEKDQMKPEFIKMNPQHTIPTLDDNGFYLWESRAIMQYLANAYAKTDDYYPKAAKKRALVDQRLLFDQGTLYKAYFDLYLPIAFLKQPFDTEKAKKLDEALGFLEEFLSQTKYAAGDSLTLADFTIMASLSSIEESGHELKDFPLVIAYMNRCKGEIKGYDENEEGAAILGNLVKGAIKSLNEGQ